MPQPLKGNEFSKAVDDSLLNFRLPFGKWEIVDVQFPSTANADYVIPHSLNPDNPGDVQYTVLRQTTVGAIYESTAPDRKPWTGKYIVLRSDTENWQGRLLLTLLEDTRPFNGTTSDGHVPTPPSSDAFGTISVSGQSDVVADQPNDTLTLAAGSGVVITTDASTDTVTIEASATTTTPAGANKDVQFNNSGSFGADTGVFTYDTPSHTLGVDNIASQVGSNLAVVATPPASGAGTAVSITAGSATSGSSANGGNVNITAGNRSVLGTAGSVVITGGGTGGGVTLAGGTGNGAGGNINITSGGTSGTTSTGTITVATAPAAGGTIQDVGALTVKTGDAYASTVHDLTISTGTRTHVGSNTSGGVGGSLILSAGAGQSVTSATSNVTGGDGGPISITTGAGGTASPNSNNNRINISGGGGQLSLAGGAGGAISTSGSTDTVTGGAGADVVLTAGAGGVASGSSGSRTGGDGGDVLISSGAKGTGATANGNDGAIVFKVGATEIGRFAADGTLKLAGLADGPLATTGGDGTVGIGGATITDAVTSVEVSGQPTITTSGATALTLVAGTNVTITTDNTAKSATIDVSGAGFGDVSGPGSSVDGEVALFSGTTGKVIKRFGGTGFVKAASGVVSAVNAVTLGTDVRGLVIGFIVANGSPGSNVGPMLQAPRAGTVSTCLAVVKGSDSSVGLLFNINLNGSPLFSSNQSIVAGTSAGTTTTFALTSAPVPVALGDVFSLDITQGSSQWELTLQVQ